MLAERRDAMSDMTRAKALRKIMDLIDEQPSSRDMELEEVLAALSSCAHEWEACPRCSYYPILKRETEPSCACGERKLGRGWATPGLIRTDKYGNKYIAVWTLPRGERDVFVALLPAEEEKV